ncbi:MAG: hypothetical protein M1834_001058 [Cirrosporium novae-zelandiae]|nr:MAG: hypothetical protein M1834_001058 [Cirrosporium novae-zelandiae]
MDDGVDLIQVSSASFKVPSLGEIDGLCFDGKTCQYLGIPYASIPGRFRRPQPAPVPWPGEKWDGTKFGPHHPQPPRDFYPIPVPHRPWVENPPTSEKDCLNLNISVPYPPNSKEITKPLPVMVFLHGGAFTYAAGSAGMYDGRVLADISREENSPTIIISMNYRLGVLGFLASEEIRAYNKAHGEEGVGNYGLWDQVEALRWVQKYISAFGGDPTKVTLFGQSAGGGKSTAPLTTPFQGTPNNISFFAVSINAHLLRGEPLFSSAILQSGLLPLCGIMSVQQYQVLYEKTLKRLEIPEDLPPEARLTHLLNTPEATLTASMPDVFLTPVITMALCDDYTFLPNQPMPSYSHLRNFHTPPWCPRLMIGDAKNECIIWNKAYRHLTTPPTTLQSYILSLPNPSANQTLLSLYNLTNQTLTPDETFTLLETFTTDALYLSPNHDLQLSNPSQTLAYHFDEPSPYPNEWHGLAHHSLDNVFIWNVLRHTLPLTQQIQARRMAKFWLQFAGGGQPWVPFGMEKRVMVFGGGEAEVKTVEEDKGRGYERWGRIRELGLVEEWGRLADEICIRRSELVDPLVGLGAMVV